MEKKVTSLKISNRLQKLRQGLAEKEIDAILISQPENRYYLSGFDGSSGSLVITPQNAILATDFRYIEQAKAQAPDYEIFRIIIEQAGYGQAFGHGLGHGIGLAPHEQPHLGPKSVEHIVDGMVFTIEPGIYLPGWGGVRIEDVVVTENGKARVISKARKR